MMMARFGSSCYMLLTPTPTMIIWFDVNGDQVNCVSFINVTCTTHQIIFFPCHNMSERRSCSPSKPSLSRRWVCKVCTMCMLIESLSLSLTRPINEVENVVVVTILLVITNIGMVSLMIMIAVLRCVSMGWEIAAARKWGRRFASFFPICCLKLVGLSSKNVENVWWVGFGKVY